MTKPNIYRKKSKILFLSYTYGMSIKNILSSIEQQGGNKKIAKEYFSEFNTFEQWKEQLYEKFKDEGRISTVYGNHLKRTLDGELIPKEKRSVVSHIVQGTGSCIFKSALLELSKQDCVEIVIPMHDAVLIQHPETYNPTLVVSVFESIMTRILDGKINGKASIEQFYCGA
ncbi:MAG: hypothetical protein JEZ12_28565 [Desulfobacterium sp.]|nr:hypothetical protein [Desulfobacterium sp.]